MIRLLWVTSSVLVLSLGFSACETAGGPGGASVLRPGEAGKKCSLPQYGLRVAMPAGLVGRYVLDSEDTTLVFSTLGSTAVFIDAIYVGDIESDENALARVLLAQFKMEYPASGLKRVDSAPAADGRQWLHFESLRPISDSASLWQYLSVTREGPYIYSFVASDLFEPGGELREALVNAWKGVSISKPEDPASQPRTTREKNLSEAALAQIWQSYYTRQRFVEAAKAADALQALKPKEADFAEISAETLLSGQMYEEGLARMPDWEARFPHSSDLVWRKAYMLAETGHNDEAMREYRRAIHDMGNSTVVALNAYFSFLQVSEQLGKHAAEIDRLAVRAGMPHLHTYVVRAWQEAGDEEKFKVALDRLEREAQVLPDLNESLVDIYLDKEDYTSALATARRLSEKKNPLGNLLAGIVLYREGRYSEARREAQECLKLQPTNGEARKLLEVVNAQLGKADSSLFDTPIEPVPLPQGLLAGIPAAPTDFAGGHGAYLQYSGTLYAYRKDQRKRTTHYERFTVTRQSALHRMSERTYRFDPLYERVYVNLLRVYGPGGELIAEGDLANYYSSADSDEVLMSQRKELHLPIPSLEVGCSVELAVSYETLGPQDRMQFKKHILASDMPGQLFFVGVTGDVDDVTILSANGIEERPLDGGRLFVANDPVPVTMTPNAPPAKEYLPMLWISAAGRNWSEVSAEYFERVTDFMAPSEEAAAKTRELVGENPDPDQAVARITTFVRDSMTYQGLVFGIHSQIPNYCADILSNRYGDCKDHSFLLMHMLRSAGIKAYPALVDTERAARADLPDMGEFNHMIVYLPDFHGGHFIDATDKFATLASVPFGLGGEPALILDPKDPRIVEIPEYRVEDNRVSVSRGMEIKGQDLLINERVELSGYIAGWLRSLFQDVTEREYPLTLSDATDLREFDTVSNVVVENLEDRELPLIVSYSFELPAQFHAVGGLLTGRAPGTWEQLMLNQSPDEADRRAPIWHRLPLTIDTSAQLKLPEGYHVSDAVQLAHLQTSTPYLSFDFTPSNGGASLELRSSLRSHAGLFAATEAAARRQAFDSASAAVQHPIALERAAP